MPTSQVRKEDLQREIRRLINSGREEFAVLIENWPGPEYEPQDPSTYPDDDESG